MEFSLSPDLLALCARVRHFLDEHVLPLERDPSSFNEYENIKLTLRDDIRRKAREAGLWAPQMPQTRGGLGLDMVGQAAFYEEASRSIFGPSIFNCAAPDDGNMRLLEQVARDDQKERWLQPIIDGKVNSSFAMTEPHPGGGSDPGMIQTKAVRDGDRWFVTGQNGSFRGRMSRSILS